MKRMLAFLTLTFSLIPLGCDSRVMEPEAGSLAVSGDKPIKVKDGVVKGAPMQFVALTGSPPTQSMWYWQVGSLGHDLTPTGMLTAVPGSWSPDGLKLAFTGQVPGPSGVETNIYVMDVAADGTGGSVVQVSYPIFANHPPPHPPTLPLQDWMPVWSPDGNKIAWLCTTEAYPHPRPSPPFPPNTFWWEQNESICSSEFANGVWGPRVVLTNDPVTGGTTGVPVGTYYAEGIPSWSPRGDKILFNRMARGCDQDTDCPFKSWDLFTLDIATGTEVNVTMTPSDDEYEASWQPFPVTSTTVVFQKYGDSDSDDLYIGDISSLSTASLFLPAPTPEREAYPMWTPSGKEITYTKAWRTPPSPSHWEGDVFLADVKGNYNVNLTNSPSVLDQFARMRPPFIKP